jgi:hypothetical protein
MNHPTQNPIADNFSSGSGSRTGEDTLRLIASLPAPEGLSDRVQARLLTAPRSGRVLAWPAAFATHSGLKRSEWTRPEWMRSEWVRSAAAAAIVFVVVGGGWGVYSRVQQPQSAKVIVLPPRVAAPGSFANAGAMRTPQTLNGPVLAHPATAQPPVAKTPAKSSAPIVLNPAHPGKSAANKANVQAVAPAAR